MKYLVTGAAGFIGSHLTDTLIAQGHQVVALDNMATGKRLHINPVAEFHEADFTDEVAIDSLFKGVDGVFHVGALARIQPSFENPDLYFLVNAVGTRNVLVMAKKHGIKRVVYSASSSAYGPVTEMPLSEELKVSSQALHPYGSTKRMGEMLMRDMGRVTGGPETVCLRYFNVYGPRQTNSLDGPYPTVVGIFLDMVREGKPLPIVPSGYQQRDFTHVSDVVAANIAAMNSSKVGDAEIINIGTGCSYSMWGVARLVLQLPEGTTSEEMLRSGKCIMAPARRGEVFQTLADISRAKELLDWEPRMSFKDGIKNLLS